MKPVLIAIFLLFGAYSLYVISEVGYFGIFAAVAASPGSLQVARPRDRLPADLVVDGDRCAREGAQSLALPVHHARGGSFGPLLYLLLAGERSAGRRGVIRARDDEITLGG